MKSREGQGYVASQHPPRLYLLRCPMVLGAGDCPQWKVSHYNSVLPLWLKCRLELFENSHPVTGGRQNVQSQCECLSSRQPEVLGKQAPFALADATLSNSVDAHSQLCLPGVHIHTCLDFLRQGFAM